jgi:hypothetical protein
MTTLQAYKLLGATLRFFMKKERLLCTQSSLSNITWYNMSINTQGSELMYHRWH